MVPMARRQPTNGSATNRWTKRSTLPNRRVSTKTSRPSQSPNQRRPKNQRPGWGKSHVQARNPRLQSQARKSPLLSRVRKTGHLSISRVRVRQHDRARPNASSLPWTQRGAARSGRRVEARLRVKRQQLQLLVFERVSGRGAGARSAAERFGGRGRNESVTDIT